MFVYFEQRNEWSFFPSAQTYPNLDDARKKLTAVNSLTRDITVHPAQPNL